MLVADQLVSARAGRAVHAPVSFELGTGEALLLRGGNGSGKSTLLRTLVGFLRPASGSATWNSMPITDGSWATAVHWIAHANALKAQLTVRENLRLSVDLAGAGHNRLKAATAAFGLEKLLDEPVGRLSQGQRHRVSLARLLDPVRPVWLLDEPAVGLDAANAARLADLVRNHRHGGGIVVVATHGDVAVDDPLVLDL